MTQRLDWRVKQEVSYCIPFWVRDEQIKRSSARTPARLQPHDEPRPESAAIVGYGPSLADTWEKIRGHEYIFTCSGAHRFLLDRGIVPTYHVAVDPLPGNTVRLIGPPHPNVEYLIASTCHPDVLDHLVGYRVTLWHVFDSAEEALRVLPAGEWALTGGCDVGLRALVIAAFLGFRDLHVFGLDGSARATRHAGPHPSPLKQYAVVEYDGVEYQTTPGMLEAARSVWHELDQLPRVKATFYGEGLIQHMARNYTPNPALTPSANTVAFQKPELMSATYRDLNARLHRDNLAYGVGGDRHAATVLTLAERLKTKNILDYGCGKGYLAKAIPWAIAEYDPAIPGKDESPKPADLVVCTDVLEHVEPDKLRDVLRDLQRCIRLVGYVTINTGPAQKALADGRNTHLIQRPLDWWRAKLGAYFTIGTILPVGPEIRVVVGPKAAA